jgi:O-antigen/teichoic acid export membrane protein
MNKRYGGERIKRGFIHFMLGKVISAVVGIIAVMLVVRELSIESFAAYSTLVALVEIVSTISGLGFAHALIRYVPELYARHFQTSLRKFVFVSVVLRTGVLLLATVGSYIFAPYLASLIGLGSVVEAFRVFLLVVLLRSTTQFISLILESTLHQGITQFSFLSAGLVRMIGMIVLMNNGHVQLIDVIWVEAFADGLSFFAILSGLIYVVIDGAKDNDPSDDGTWLSKHLRQIIKFALTGYIQHLAIKPYGGDTNRLVGGNMLSIGGMATFGFAQSICEYIRRYMPAQLLVGMIRPVIVARYCERRDFSTAAKLCANVLQINILLIGGIIAVLLVGGEDALTAISAGKYGTDALYVLTALIFVLLLETQRQQLDLLVQVVECYQYLISSNILLSASIGLAVILLPKLGAMAFPVANGLGLLVANAWVQRKMSRDKLHFRHNWLLTFRVVVICEATMILGELAKQIGLPWYVALVFSVFIYAILGFFVCGDLIANFVRDLTKRQDKQSPGIDAAKMKMGSADNSVVNKSSPETVD